jgi:hypothetical protein
MRFVLALLLVCAASGARAQWTSDAYGGTTPGHIGVGVASHPWMRIRLTNPDSGATEMPGSGSQISFGTPAATWWSFRLDAANNLHLDRQAPPWTEGVVFRLNGDVGIATAQPKGRLDINDTSQALPRLVFSGQEFYQPGITSSDGVALLLGVNRNNNRQLWIADTAALAQNGTNTALRFGVGGGPVHITALATDGTTPKTLVLNNAGGNVGIGISQPLAKFHSRSCT